MSNTTLERPETGDAASLGRSKTLMVLTGKMGDNLLSCPIAQQYAKKYGHAVDLLIRIHTPSLARFLEKQDWCARAWVEDETPPWCATPDRFGSDLVAMRAYYPEYENVYHLGFRQFPTESLTLGCLNDCPVERNLLLKEPCFKRTLRSPRTLAIHMEASDPKRNAPTLATLKHAYARLRPLFEKVRFIVTKDPDESVYAPFFTDKDVDYFNDGGDLQKTVELLEESLLFGTGSSMYCLAHGLRSPNVCVVDDVSIGLVHYRPNKIYHANERMIWRGDSTAAVEAVQALLRFAKTKGL